MVKTCPLFFSFVAAVVVWGLGGAIFAAVLAGVMKVVGVEELAEALGVVA